MEGLANTAETHLVCANPCSWTAEERRVHGDDVHEGNAITKALRAHGDALNSLEMPWGTILGFWDIWFHFPKSIWLLRGTCISEIWVRTQLGRDSKYKTQWGDGYHCLDSCLHFCSFNAVQLSFLLLILKEVTLCLILSTNSKVLINSS